jgi:UMF1 family MFS transporter
MSTSEVIVFGVVLNVAAGLGAFLFGFVDDRWGGKRTVMISLGALATACIVAAAAPSRTWFWIAGLLVGIFAGPNQAASRSLMGRFVPREREAEFFGFFAFSGKLTSFAGPLLLGWTATHFATQRAGIASILLFLVVGAILLAPVDEKKGRETAGFLG